MSTALPGPFWLDPRGDPTQFPDPALALDEPNGLLAVGGDLSVARLQAAYRHGIFPWYSSGQPILWWTPNPRMVLFPKRLKVSRSLRKTLNKDLFHITFDRAFEAVVHACAEPRAGQDGTWITPQMMTAYQSLHHAGLAHSVETWEGEVLVGGLYGVAIGRVFFGESMFTRRNDASKVAFVHLVRRLQAWDFGLIDCQMATTHLASLGAEAIPREHFQVLLEHHCVQPGPTNPWSAMSKAED